MTTKPLTTPNTSTFIPLTDTEIEQLEALLASPIFEKQAMGLDEMQGFLCAVLSGPTTVTEAQWLPAVLGNPKYETPTQGEEIASLIRRFHNEIAADLAGGESVGLLLQRDDGAAENDYDYETWCQSYLDGVEFSAVPWDEAGDADEVNELLFPIALLAGEIEPKALKQIKPRDMAQLLTECREDLPLITIDIYEYFLKVRGEPVPAPGDRKPKKLH